jgi:hypothetical protein
LAYQATLLLDLARMHNVFHVSMLRKYFPNPDFVVEYELLEIQEEQMYDKMPVQFMDHKEQVLRTKKIPIVNVLWYNHGVEEASWEADKNMSCYPRLFEKA